MPIRHYLQGQGVAFEMALVTLQHADGPVAPTRDAVAQKIIELAKAGERDPERLCHGALKATMLISDPSPPPPPGKPPARLEEETGDLVAYMAAVIANLVNHRERGAPVHRPLAVRAEAKHAGTTCISSSARRCWLSFTSASSNFTGRNPLQLGRDTRTKRNRLRRRRTSIRHRP